MHLITKAEQMHFLGDKTHAHKGSVWEVSAGPASAELFLQFKVGTAFSQTKQIEQSRP